MLHRIFGLSRSARPQTHSVSPEVAPGSRIYAIGDIHGRLDLLQEMHQLIHEDAYRRQAPRNVAIYLGDYIDRGTESAGVIDFLLDRALPSFESIHLMGNHEESLLRFLGDTGIGLSWMQYGGAATLLSYGVRPPRPGAHPEDVARAQGELAARLPERHRRFMTALKLSCEEGDYFFTHAGVRPGVPLDRQSAEDMMWIRDEFLASDAEFGKIIVHGHTITERPDVQRNRIGIDTGAFASGTLTCLVLEGAEWTFLQT
jgi:serine/threonine protein phosphatase 1